MAEQDAKHPTRPGCMAEQDALHPTSRRAADAFMRHSGAEEMRFLQILSRVRSHFLPCKKPEELVFQRS